MRKICSCFVCAMVGLLCACSSDEGETVNRPDMSEGTASYVLPESEAAVSEADFLSAFSQGSWYLNDVTNVMDDGTEISRKKEWVDGKQEDVRLFAFLLGESPSSFAVTNGNQLKETCISDANGIQAIYYKGSFSYDEGDMLLTIRTGSASEIDGRHRVMAVSDDELVISGRPYLPNVYPEAVYAVYVYHHEPFIW